MRKFKPDNHRAAALAAALLFTAACGDDDTAAADAGPGGDVGSSGDISAASNTPGKKVLTLTLQGIKRQYIVYVPDKAKGKQVPVVFMIHGTSGDGQKFYNISGWREEADAEGLIAVFPSGLTYCFREDENGDGDMTDKGELKVTTKWADGKLSQAGLQPLCEAADLASLTAKQQALVNHPLADDVAFVKQMLQELQTRYVVDSKRIYATGFSNGGNFASRLMMELSDKLAAVVASSGSLHVTSTPSRAMSVLHTLGEVEAGITAALGLKAVPMVKALPTQVPTIGASIAKYLQALSLKDSYTYKLSTVAGKKMARYSYAESSAGGSNSYSFVVIEGATHQYPNGKNHPVVMADILWEFFKKHTLP